MNIEALQQLLDAVAAGKTSVARAAEFLKHLAYEDIGFAHVDHHWTLRKGFPEVICDGEQGRVGLRCRCCRYSPAFRLPPVDERCNGFDRRGGYGGGPAQCGRRNDRSSGDRRSDQRGLRRQFRRTDRPFQHAQQLQFECRGGQHRQWLLCRLHGRQHQQTVTSSQI